MKMKMKMIKQTTIMSRKFLLSRLQGRSSIFNGSSSRIYDPPYVSEDIKFEALLRSSQEFATCCHADYLTSLLSTGKENNFSQANRLIWRQFHEIFTVNDTI